MDLTMRSYLNGTINLPMLSSAYGTLVDQDTPLDQASYQYRKPRSIPIHPNVDSTSQTPPREAR